MKKNKIDKKYLIVYFVLVFASVNLMLPVITPNKNGNQQLNQLMTIAYADTEVDDPILKPFDLWDQIFSLTD